MFGVIFDYDGLMVDSEPLQSQAHERIIRKYSTIMPIYDEHGFVHVVGISTEANTRRIMKLYNINEDLAVLQKEKAASLFELTTSENVKPQPGLKELLEELRANRISVVVASGNFRGTIEKGLETIDVRDYFHGVVSNEDITLGKPDPQTFLIASRKIGVSPQRCVVLEDSATGIEGAKNAGMIAVAVVNEFTRDQDFRRADMGVGSLEQVNIRLLSSLVEARIQREGVRRERGTH